MLQLMREGSSYTYPPLSIARYSFIQLSELAQCRVIKLAQGFNNTAQDSNPGSRSRVSEALPMSHCALQALPNPLLYSERLGTDHGRVKFVINNVLISISKFMNSNSGERWSSRREDGGSIPPTAVSKLRQFRSPTFACVFRERH